MDLSTPQSAVQSTNVHAPDRGIPPRYSHVPPENPTLQFLTKLADALRDVSWTAFRAEVLRLAPVRDHDGKEPRFFYEHDTWEEAQEVWLPRIHPHQVRHLVETWRFALGCERHGFQVLPDAFLVRSAFDLAISILEHHYEDATAWEAWAARPPLLNEGRREDRDLVATWGKTAVGLLNMLAVLGVGLRWNVLASRPEWRCQADERPDDHGHLLGWRQFDDRASAWLREETANRFFTGDNDDPKPVRFGRDSWQSCLAALLYEMEQHPFATYLESLPPWDGHPRMEHWLDQCLDVFPDDVDRAMAQLASRHILLGAVTRTYRPGAKVDEMPVLIQVRPNSQGGHGGIGKSTALRQLLPTEMQHDLFSDGLYLAADRKQRAEALQGRVIVEAAEMAGSTRAEIDSLKSFLSSTDDGHIRLAYRRDPEKLLRRCIIVGTSDQDAPLPNDDNLRRFIPVRLTGGNPADVYRYMEEHREQLWAETLVAYRAGASMVIPAELKPVQATAAERVRSRDIGMEDAVASYLAGEHDGFTLGELASNLALIKYEGEVASLEMKDQHRIARALRTNGYEARRGRTGGTNVTRWYRKGRA